MDQDTMTSDSDDHVKRTSHLDENEVVDYLRHHKDLLVRHPDLMDVLDLPNRFDGERVIDFQFEALRRLRAQQNDLVDTSRINLSVQLSTHEAVLAMLEARSLDELIGIVQDEVPILLDVDMAAIALEGAVEKIDISADGMPVLLPLGEVDKRLSTLDVLLCETVAPGDEIFGTTQDLVKSAALARLYQNDAMPAGLLILGSRDEGAFHPQQGHELITFLARVAEILVERWLETSTE